MKLITYLISYSKIDSTWTVDINIKDKRVKLPDDNIEKYIYNFGIGKGLLNRTRAHTHTRLITCSSKDPIMTLEKHMGESTKASILYSQMTSISQ